MRQDWYPGAKQRPIESKIRPRSVAGPNALVEHIAAGNSLSLYDFFSSPLRGCSHFYVLENGTIEQYLPISSRGGSTRYGNNRAVSVETQGGAGGWDKIRQPWAPAQVAALTELAAWMNVEWGIPLEMMANSQTLTSGVGYHRLGIDGNFPAKDPLYSGRTQRGGGELWTFSFGKTCPENFALPLPKESRILQIVDIIADAREIVGGIPVEPPPPIKPPPVKPKPPKPEDKRIDEDGYWGRDTTSLGQEIHGTPIDGEVWRQNERWQDDMPGCTYGWKWGEYDPKGSPFLRKQQEIMKADGQYHGTIDGVLGPEHAKGLQRRYGTSVDGELWAPSPAIKKMQAAYNKGKF